MERALVSKVQENRARGEGYKKQVSGRKGTNNEELRRKYNMKEKKEKEGTREKGLDCRRKGTRKER
jgi:hypothetical protein